MSDKATLTSRLRVLVARTFRAEKLYSSIRSADSSTLTNAAALADMANDLRGKEWQQAHFRLRTSLNDVLKLGNSGAMNAALRALHAEFLQAREQSVVEITTGIEELKATAERQEFAHVLRLSTSLIQSKARAQVHKVIVEELESIIDTNVTGKNKDEVDVSFLEEATAEYVSADGDAEHETPSNVIPLRRHAGFGRRR